MEAILTLALLILLQAVLGFDNLLYISLESKRAPEEQQSKVRKFGIGLAIVLRIGLLFLLVNLIGYFQEPFLNIKTHFLTGNYNLHSLIVLLGGVFIVYTAIKEIWHMMRLEDDDDEENTKPKSTWSVIMMIALMNVVFSFDSILSAMALTDEIWIMTTAIVISGGLMMLLADGVSNFLKKNRMYEVIGLFILLIVGVMLLTEGGHLAHMKLFGNEITPMNTTTFYFVIFVIVVVEIVQTRYQRKLNK
jgi:predicted tellurium resistance membrane protein TerC